MSKKWSEKEVELLLLLRGNNVPYKKCLPHFPDRTQDALRFKIYEINNVEKLKGLDFENIGVLDVETTNFKANIGFMLSWSIYWPNEDKTTFDVIKKRDITNFSKDKRICKTLLKELDRMDLMIGYNSTRFDIPFMRTRCLMNGLDFPAYGTIRHIDCYYFARGKVATHRKSLDAISTALGVGGKTPVDISVWAKAMLGHPESLETVLEHNIIDVKVTWDVYQELIKYGKYTHKSI